MPTLPLGLSLAARAEPKGQLGNSPLPANIIRGSTVPIIPASGFASQLLTRESVAEGFIIRLKLPPAKAAPPEAGDHAKRWTSIAAQMAPITGGKTEQSEERQLRSTLCYQSQLNILRSPRVFIRKLFPARPGKKP